MRNSSARRRRVVVLMMCLVGAAVGVGCGDEESASTTTSTASAETTTTEMTVETTTTVSMATNIESLSYLIQGLLTTDEVGRGWVDQGRQLVPQGSGELSGFLCEEGEQMVADLGGRLGPQVSTTFKRPGDVGLSTSETLMWGDREQLTVDFETFAAALTACAGTPYSTADLGDLSLEVTEAPALGTAAVAFRFGPSTPPTETPWLEYAATAVLLSDPNESVALVVGVGATTVHDPSSAAVTTLDPDEYSRIVEAAVDRIMQGL